MSSKQLHIISVGTSLLSNFGRSKGEFFNFSDEQFWEEKAKDTSFREEIKTFLRENPKRASAEINSLFSFLEKRRIENPKNVYIYMVETLTAAGQLSSEILQEFLKEEGFTILGDSKSIPGYFRELKEGETKKESFEKGLSELLQSLIELALKHKKDKEVLFNPTGGFKAHVGILFIAASLTGSLAYYIHEEFRDVIEIRPLFYVPKDDKEKEFLKLLYEKKRLLKYELEKIDEKLLQKLSNLQLINYDEERKEIKLLPLGELIVSNLV